jgi:REP element-mobilizing transposase RayT
MRDDNLGMPLAYFLTFRTYGTWLHGDERGSVDRLSNVYNTPKLPADPRRLARNEGRRVLEPAALDAGRRDATQAAIRETCDVRGWSLCALNVRTNHVHSVVWAPCAAERVLNAFKANATRVMRERGLWRDERSPWSRGGSTKYLWNETSLEAAIFYVLHRQGPPLP